MIRRLVYALALGGLAAHFLARTLLAPLAAIPREPADFAHHHAAARAILGGESPYRVADYDYPPLPALLALPLALLPLPTARLVWFSLSWAALVGAAALAWRLLGGGRVNLLVVAAVWSLAGTAAENLVLGQLNPLLLLLVVGAWWGLARGSPATTHGALAAAAALKIWPAAVLAVHAVARRGRVLAAGAGVALLGLAASWLPLALLPAPRLPTTAGFWRGTPALLNFSLPAVALRLADPARPGQPLPADWVHGNDPEALALPAGRAALSVAVAVLTLAIGLWLLVRAAPPGLRGEDLPLAAAALIALALAASPIAWYHYQLLQLPGLALLAGRALGACAVETRGRLACAALRLGGLGLLLVGLTWTHRLGIGSYVARHGWTAASPLWLWAASSLVPALSLVCFALLLAELRRR